MEERKLSFEQACRMYLHRFTMDHVPNWALEPRLYPNELPDGRTVARFYAPHFRSDREWYENTKFPGERGWLGIGSECYTTNLTWPLGKSLNQPFKKGQSND